MSISALWWALCLLPVFQHLWEYCWMPGCCWYQWCSESCTAWGESLSALGGRLGSSCLSLCAKVSGSLSSQCRRRAGWLIGMHTTNAPPSPSQPSCPHLLFLLLLLLLVLAQGAHVPLSCTPFFLPTPSLSYTQASMQAIRLYSTCTDKGALKHAHTSSTWWDYVNGGVYGCRWGWNVCVPQSSLTCWVHSGQSICSLYRWPLSQTILHTWFCTSSMVPTEFILPDTEKGRHTENVSGVKHTFFLDNLLL